MSPTIYTLPPVRRASSVSSDSNSSWSMRSEIEAGLRGTAEPTIPGSRAEDKKWAYTKSVPTVVLYDEEGLRLYDKITADAPEYYLFNDELNLLKNHGHEIARFMGFQDSRKNGYEEPRNDPESQPEKRWKSARWGDDAVGKWNEGVNGEQALGEDGQNGWDVVELGAGALRKTAHLLKALSSALPPTPTHTDSSTPPITYHPLDLSYPELVRVLGEMHEAIGDEIDGKVACIGLHGDYEAGLEFIRDGQLAPLSQSLLHENPNEVSVFQNKSGSAPQDIPSGRSSIPEEDGHCQSPLSVHLVTPRDIPSPLPQVGDVSIKCGRSGSQDSSMSTSERIFENYGNERHARNAIRDASPASSEPAASTDRRPLHFVFLGSSLGNFDRDSAPGFLKSLPLAPGDTLLLGLDGRPAPGEEGRRKVELAYNDPRGHTKRFEEHGWDIVKEELGVEGDVEFVGRYNEELGRHEAYFRVKDQQVVRLPTHNEELTLDKGELLHIEWSYKYSIKESMDLFNESDLRVIKSWKAPDSEYRLWLLERPPVRFIAPPSNDISSDHISSLNMDKSITGGQIEKVKGVPKWEEWIALWKLWDSITLDMIPRELLHQKPIDLRHICLFYLGHIPTFLDIHLTRLTNGRHTAPEYFKTIFERGIDPDVDDPTQCHDHSEVPMSEDDWPSLSEILDFRDRVRQRLHGIYLDFATGKVPFSRHAGRVLFMGFEHEAQHAETLLYMLAQSPLTRVPQTVKPPQWDILAKDWAAARAKNKVLDVPSGEIVLGHDDAEDDDAAFPTAEGWENHEFGWDDESPKVTQHVKAFKADTLPITNNDYRHYLSATGLYSTLDSDSAPASWTNVTTTTAQHSDSSSAEWRVCSFYGPLSFDVAGDWPLMASKLEIEAYAKWKGGRLPTEAELRKVWEHEDGPRVNGELNNVGFQNWHPVPPTNTFTDNAGNVIHGHNGGVWEWTDTPLAGHDGFVPSKIYPGYSSDFFDGKHFVVLGGSYATIPQVAGRKSFRNWYQANYKYSFIGGRVVYDV